MRRSLPYVKRILWTLIDVKNEKMAEIQAKKMPGICRNTLMPRSFVGFRPEVPEAAHRFLVVLLEHPGQVVEGKRERRRRLIIYF